VQARVLAARSGALVRVDPRGGGATQVLAGATDAVWSPDGTQVAFARGGDLWTANSDGTGIRRILATPKVVESEPAWSPSGALIAYTASAGGRRQVRIVPARGGGSTRVSSGAGDAWSPSFSHDPSRVAFLARPDTGQLEIDVAPIGGGRASASLLSDERAGTPIDDARDLSWSRDESEFAYTAVYGSETAVVVDSAAGQQLYRSPEPSSDERPVWSPAGTELAYDTVEPDGTRSLRVLVLATAATRVLGSGSPLDWRTVPLGRPLFPDLVQRPPSGLVVTRSAGGRWLLGFTSLVDNRGPGVLWIRARRPPGSNVMDASQLVELADGGARILPGAGQLHYTVAPPHYHWHLLHFVRFELRRTRDFKLLVRDRKSGFCLADHYGIAPGMRHGPPRFLGNCAQFHPEARSTEEGTSVGYTDRYPANFHGQNLDITGVPTGTYWLVHRVNADFSLRERRYDNDVASLLVRITWPGGHAAQPQVTALRSCRAERC
jgi:hypothetical protein